MRGAPSVSRVDAGTLEMVRACGVEIVSSPNWCRSRKRVGRTRLEPRIETPRACSWRPRMMHFTYLGRRCRKVCASRI